MIADYFASGLSCRSYYQKHNISECQFYGWKRKYIAAHPELASSAKKSNASDDSSVLLPIDIKSRPAEPPLTPLPVIEILYPSGITVRFNRSVHDLSHIERLLLKFH